MTVKHIRLVVFHKHLHFTVLQFIHLPSEAKNVFFLNYIFFKFISERVLWSLIRFTKCLEKSWDKQLELVKEIYPAYVMALLQLETKNSYFQGSDFIFNCHNVLCMHRTVCVLLHFLHELRNQKLLRTLCFL